MNYSLFTLKKTSDFPVRIALNKKKMRINRPINSHFIQFRCWQRVIFPGSGPPSIFASVSLYDRVRDDSSEQND